MKVCEHYSNGLEIYNEESIQLMNFDVNTIIAVLITLLVWGSLIVLEIYWKRPWVQWVILIIFLSTVWVVIGYFWSFLAIVLSTLIHSAFFFYILRAFILDRREGDDVIWKRPK